MVAITGLRMIISYRGFDSWMADKSFGGLWL